MIFYVLTGFFLVCAGIILFSNLKISVSRFEFSGDRQLKILQLSDLHKKKFGKGYGRLLKKIPQENFDAVFFTGDLISRSETDFCRKTKYFQMISYMEALRLLCIHRTKPRTSPALYNLNNCNQ